MHLVFSAEHLAKKKAQSLAHQKVDMLGTGRPSTFFRSCWTSGQLAKRQEATPLTTSITTIIPWDFPCVILKRFCDPKSPGKEGHFGRIMFFFSRCSQKGERVVLADVTRHQSRNEGTFAKTTFFKPPCCSLSILGPAKTYTVGIFEVTFLIQKDLRVRNKLKKEEIPKLFRGASVSIINSWGLTEGQTSTRTKKRKHIHSFKQIWGMSRV